MDVVFVDLEVVDAVALRRIQLDFTDAPRELRAARRRIGNDRNEQGRQQPHHFSLLRQSTASVYCVSLLRQSTASVYCDLKRGFRRGGLRSWQLQLEASRL